MNLEEIFYTLSIAFFVSFWVIVAAAIVALVVLYRRMQEFRQSLGSKSLTLLAGGAPALTLLWPILQKGWSLWKKKRKE